MAASTTFLGPQSACSYLPAEKSRFEYAWLGNSSAADYMAMMLDGWRRFGSTAFRPRCRACSRCRSLRIAADGFRPDRSQRRAWARNAGHVRIEIGRPSLDEARFALYHRYHSRQTEAKDWPSHDDEGPEGYIDSFVENPFPTEEWRYFLGDDLLGVGLVDALPDGLSGIYFYYDPDRRDRSPGTFNVLSLIEESRRRSLPHVYLGYFVEGSASMQYKARFGPNETLEPDGRWIAFR